MAELGTNPISDSALLLHHNEPHMERIWRAVIITKINDYVK